MATLEEKLVYIRALAAGNQRGFQEVRPGEDITSALDFLLSQEPTTIKELPPVEFTALMNAAALATVLAAYDRLAAEAAASDGPPLPLLDEAMRPAGHAEQGG